MKFPKPNQKKKLKEKNSKHCATSVNNISIQQVYLKCNQNHAPINHPMSYHAKLPSPRPYFININVKHQHQ